MQPNANHDGMPNWVYAVACAIIFAMGILVASNARAADKGGPAVPELPSVDYSSKPFSGGYIGGFVAYPTQTTSIAGGLMSFDASALCYGGNLGYDVRWASTNIVTGVKASGSFCNVGNALVDADKHWDVMGRAGFVLGQTTLMYGLLGYYNDGADFTVPVALQMPDKGIAFGLGIESYMTKHITAFAEVLAVDNGSSGAGLGAFESKTWVPRVGLNWRF